MSDYQPPPDRNEGYPPPGGPPSYPGYPQYSAPYGEPMQRPAPPQPPPSILTAVRLMWGGAALTAISLIVALATLSSLKDKIRDRLMDDNGGVLPSNFDAIYNTTVATEIAVSLISIGIWLWMAQKNRQGRSWARTVATVLAGLNVLANLLSVLGGQELAVSAVLGVLNLILALAILVFLWRPESTAFYQATTQHRRQFGA
jgi:hypothetical protein